MCAATIPCKIAGPGEVRIRTEIECARLHANAINRAPQVQHLPGGVAKVQGCRSGQGEISGHGIARLEHECRRVEPVEKVGIQILHLRIIADVERRASYWI